jgi:hypothetical protein
VNQDYSPFEGGPANLVSFHTQVKCDILYSIAGLLLSDRYKQSVAWLSEQFWQPHVFQEEMEGVSMVVST